MANKSHTLKEDFLHCFQATKLFHSNMTFFPDHKNITGNSRNFPPFPLVFVFNDQYFSLLSDQDSFSLEDTTIDFLKEIIFIKMEIHDYSSAEPS